MTVGLRGSGGAATLGLVCALIALVMSIVGLFRLCKGLGYGTGVQILCLVLLFVPLVNIITLIILSTRATRMLRENGIEVGLLGAKR
ncbi:MAG: hypothetical protein JO142_10185 [Burkholderiales bacterium]|nr:hypothetical protein [Burkholderiales bacterium]